MGDPETRPDVIWDDQVRGLCIRAHSEGSKSFIFVYRIGGRQRFLRIGRSPEWSLKAARIRAKELRWIVDQGRDPNPASKTPGREVAPVEKLLRYLTEHVPRKNARQ